MPEVSLLVIFATSFGVGFSGAMIPGPILAATIPQAAQRGFWIGPALVLGHALAEIPMVVILATGLSLLPWRQIAVVIGLAGGLVLVAMGLDMARRGATGAASPSRQASTGTGAKLGPVLTGVALSLANPSWFVWWFTIGAAYILWAQGAGPGGILSFYSGHILSDLSWYSLVALAAARGARLMSPAVYRAVLGGCGLFVLVLGGYFILGALNGWFL